MARLLCCWEFGGQLGHLTNLKPFVDSALACGHEVTLAVKELDNVRTVFPDADVRLFQAPVIKRRDAPGEIPLSYADLVARHFARSDRLAIAFRAWEAIFLAVRPDVAIFDFAPGAMIASLGQPWQKWVIGNAFFVPRTDVPYLGLFPGLRKSAERRLALAAADSRLLAITNEVLHEHRRPPLGDIREMLTQMDRQLLVTLPELEYFGARPGGTYLGIAAPPPGAPPQWPDRGRLRVFGYLRNFPELEGLLGALLAQDISVIVYGRDIPAALRKSFPQIGFTDIPIDIPALREQADLVINMGSHSTCADFLLHGIPQLMVPLQQEQLFTARCVEQLGGGVAALRGTDMAAAAATAVAMARRGRLPCDDERSARLSGVLLRDTVRDLVAELS